MTISLAPRLTLGSLNLTDDPYMVEFGYDLGNGEPDTNTVDSSLIDGEFVESTRTGNRTITLNVIIEAPDMAVLADAEEKLFREASRPVSNLTVDPGDGFGKVSVFKTYAAKIRWVREEDMEAALLRRYILTIPAAPFGYSEDEVVTVAVAAAPVTPTTVVLSDGTSATGWSSPPTASAQPTVASGLLQIAPRSAPISAQYGWVSEATLALSAVDFSATPYISVDIKPRDKMGGYPIPDNAHDIGWGLNKDRTASSELGFNGYRNPLDWAAAYVDGVKLRIVNYTTLADGTLRYTWSCTDASASSLRILMGTEVAYDPKNPLTSYAPTGAAAGVTFDNVERSNVAPGQSSSGRRTSLSIDVAGSARTTASIEISHPTAGLSETLLYTSSALGAQGYEPQCRRYLQTGGLTTTTDAATLSGSRTRSAIGSPMEWNVPVSVLPAGAYLVAARHRWISTGTSGDITMTTTVAMKVGSTLYSSTVLPVTFVLPNGSSAGTKDWSTIKTLGVVHLPPQDTPPGGAGYVNISMGLSGPVGTNVYDIDDLYLFYMGDGSDITHVDCGSGTPSIGSVHNRLFIDQPTPAHPRYHLLVGTQEDRSDAFDPGYPAVTARGSHPIKPGVNRLWVATLGATYPTITYRYVPAWFTHAGQ